MECGNVIMGSVTYQMFAPVMKDVFAKLKVVVLSSKMLEKVSIQPKQRKKPSAIWSRKDLRKRVF